MNLKLEVVVIPVSDVDRAKRFCEGLGWRLDIDYATPDGSYRVIQFTPAGSDASIIFGKGEHHWWDWYAPYLSARQDGGSPEQAAAAADRRMDEVLQVAAR